MSGELTTRGEVSVVIATAMAPHRVAALDRAIRSALAQDHIGEVIVVVNGSIHEPSTLAALRSRNDIRVDYLKEGSYPAAQRRGRELVGTAYYCFLDDDDELLPGSVAARYEQAQKTGADVVVSNGYYRALDGIDVPYCRKRPGAHDDLQVATLKENWFASCGSLFKSERVTLEFFDGHTKFLEWTLLIFKLVAAQRTFSFIDHVGFRINDTVMSLSKDSRGTAALVTVLELLIDLATGPSVRSELRRRLARAHHACAEAERQDGEWRKAWRHHLRSLALPGGLAYLPYTRHLLISMRSLRIS